MNNDRNNAPVNGAAAEDDDDELYAEMPKRQYIQHPPGTEQAVIVDIRDLGLLPTSYKGVDTGEKPHILVTFQTDVRMELKPDAETGEPHKMNGKRFTISRRYVNSLADKAGLRKDVEILLGRQLTNAELRPRGFKLSSLIGMNCQITIMQGEAKEGKPVYSNIKQVAAWNVRWGAPLVVEDYIRFKDRDKNKQNDNGGYRGGTDSQQSGDDDAPDDDDAPAVEESSPRSKLITEFKQVVAEAASFGVNPKGGKIDYDSKSDEKLREGIATWRNVVNKKKSEAAASKSVEQVHSNDDDDEPDSAGETPDLTDAEFLAQGDPFADEGDEGYIADPVVRQRLIDAAAVKPKMDEAAIDKSPEETEALFGGQKLRDVVIAQRKANNQPELKEHTLALIDAIEDAEIPVEGKPLEHEGLLNSVNTFLKGKKRETVASLDALKVAQSALVKGAIQSGNITL